MAVELRTDASATATSGPRRFLFLFSDTGGGHRASSQAVKGEMEHLYGSTAQVEMVDVLVASARWPFYRFPAWYPTMVKLRGVPWALTFHLSDRARVVQTMSRLVWPYTRSPLCELLCSHPADLIVSFHPVPNWAILMALRHLNLNTPFAIVILDLVTAHAGWFAPGADLYLAPTEAIRRRGMEWGIPAERIRITGMPTRRCFADSLGIAQDEARSQLNLPKERPIVLIVGGGEGMGPIAEVIRAIARCRPSAHLIAIAGRNQDLYTRLRNLELPVPLQVEGFVSNMELWMRAADILVTKAGPNTLFEAFTAGLPCVLYAALPGQEAGNVTYTVENGAGVWTPQPKLAAEAVMSLLANPDLRARMSEQAYRLARPHAAMDIARHLWELGAAQHSQMPNSSGRGESDSVPHECVQDMPVPPQG